MSIEYYGPKKDAVETINNILKLNATGKEQDWEIELADPSKINLILDFLLSPKLNFEEKSALSLLLIGSIEDADQRNCLEESQIERAKLFFKNENKIRDRMQFFWITSNIAINLNLVEEILN